MLSRNLRIGGLLPRLRRTAFRCCSATPEYNEVHPRAVMLILFLDLSADFKHISKPGKRKGGRSATPNDNTRHSFRRSIASTPRTSRQALQRQRRSSVAEQTSSLRRPQLSCRRLPYCLAASKSASSRHCRCPSKATCNASCSLWPKKCGGACTGARKATQTFVGSYRS